MKIYYQIDITGTKVLTSYTLPELRRKYDKNTSINIYRSATGISKNSYSLENFIWEMVDSELSESMNKSDVYNMILAKASKKALIIYLMKFIDEIKTVTDLNSINELVKYFKNVPDYINEPFI